MKQGIGSICGRLNLGRMLDERKAMRWGFTVLALIPLTVRNAYVTQILTLALIYYMVAVGYNVVLNQAGMFHFGFIMYFALGAYIGALLTLKMHLSFWLVLPLAVIGTAVMSLVFSVPMLRFKGDYLSIVTLAFAEILRLVLKNWISVTNGPMGLAGIAPPRLFSYVFRGPIPFYYLSLVLCGIVFMVSQRLTYSKVGLAWSGVKQNEDSTEACGVNTLGYRYLAMVVGGSFSATAGCVFAHFLGFIDPTLAVMDQTVLILTMTILGGGSSVGLFLSSIVLTILPEMLRSLVLWRMWMLGWFFVLIMNLRPEGFTRGVIRHFKPRRDGNVPAAEGEHNEASGAITVFLGIRNVAKQRDSLSLLEVKDVTKRFGGLTAVDGVSLNIRHGEILSIIGPNGAGKTTLFNMITGTYPPTSGKILLQGADITGLKPSRIAKLGVARTFQNIKICPKMSVLDNVMISQNSGVLAECRASFMGRRLQVEGETVGATENAMGLLEYMGLTGRENHLAGDLPYAAQRRLEIARALATNPVLLLVDEPSAGMNPNEAMDLMRLLREINESGLTILMIEHNMRLAMNLSHRMVVLSYGMKIAEGEPSAIQRNPEVIKAYLGDKYVVA